MSSWGHWPQDSRRHIIQRNRAKPGIARRRCQPTRLHAHKDIPPGSHESDLPACGSCNTHEGRLEAGPPPPVRAGWVARHPSPQAPLEHFP